MGIPLLANQRYPPQQPAATEPAAAAPAAKEEESNSVTKKLCKCGCGTELPANYSWAYIRGHKPKPGSAAAKELVSDAQSNFAGKPSAKGEARVRSAGGHFTIKLSLAGLDAVWNSLSAERKAELLGHLV